MRNGVSGIKTVATIEARMNSTRLPGKVLLPIGVWRSLELQLERLKRSHNIDEIVLATTTDSSDDILVDFAQDQGIACYRGSEEDVLGRILGAAQSVGGELQVQITGDCPLIAPELVDQVIDFYRQAEPAVDFVSNEIERTFPIGLDCRVFSVAVLSEVARLCDDPIHRIHGSTYIYAGPGRHRYRCLNVPATGNLRHPDWRWTLDTPEDLMFMRRIAGVFGDRLVDLSAPELAAWLLDHQDVLSINAAVRQKVLEDG